MRNLLVYGLSSHGGSWSGVEDRAAGRRFDSSICLCCGVRGGRRYRASFHGVGYNRLSSRLLGLSDRLGSRPVDCDSSAYLSGSSAGKIQRVRIKGRHFLGKHGWGRLGLTDE